MAVDYDGGDWDDRGNWFKGMTTLNGREYLTVDKPGGAAWHYAQQGDIVKNPNVPYGAPGAWLVAPEVLDRIPEGSSFWNGAGPVLLAGGLLAGVTAPAWAGAAGASGGGAAPLPDSYWSTFADAGGGTLTDAGVTNAGTSSFDLFNPSTWSNPFSNVPPGSTTIGQELFDTGSNPAEFNPLGGDFGAGNYAPVTDLSGNAPLADRLRLSSGSNSLLNLASNLGGGLLNYFAAQRAADTQADAGREANALLWEMFQQNRADFAPWREAGVGALDNLVDLTTPDRKFDAMQLDPGYQFRYDEGLSQLEDQLRAAGKFYSGDALKAGQQYAQNFATGEFGNVFNRNASLAGLGQTAVTNTAKLGSDTSKTMAENLTDIGNVRASGYVSGINSLTGGIGNWLKYNNDSNALITILDAMREGSYRPMALY